MKNTIKNQVAAFKEQGLKPKEILKQLTEKNIKVSINSIRWYMCSSNKKKVSDKTKKTLKKINDSNTNL
jgi:uncharacterized protein YlaI